MNKNRIIVGAVAVAMVLPLLTLAATQTKSGKLKLAKATSANTAELEAAGFEHIPAPWAIGSFDSVKQVGDGLWGKRKGGSVKQDKPSIGGKMSSAGLACLSTAMDTQNTAAISALTTRDAADHAAMTARNECLKTALANTEALQQMKECNKTYMDARMASAKTAEDAVKASQTQYLTDAKTCVTANPGTDTSSLDADALYMATMVPKPEQVQSGKPPAGAEHPQVATNGDSNKPATGVNEQANAAPAKPQGEQSGQQPPKPPQEALDACASLAQDAACTFTRSNNGETVTGTCAMPPGGTALACKPAGAMMPHAEGPKK